jgi:hypothetical protein
MLAQGAGKQEIFENLVIHIISDDLEKWRIFLRKPLSGWG